MAEPAPPPSTGSDPAAAHSDLLLDVTSAANGARDLDELLAYVVDKLGDVTGWQIVHLKWSDGDRPPRSRGLWAQEADLGEQFRAAADVPWSARDQALEAEDPTWIEDLDWPGDDVLRSAILIPIPTGPDSAGLLELYSTQRRPPDPSLMRTLRQIAVQIGHVAARRALERRVADLAERQQRRFGEELHDGLGQYLTGIRLLAEGLYTRLQSEASPHAATAGRLVEAVVAARDQFRALIDEVMPTAVEANDLGDALESLATRVEHLYGVQVHVRHEPGLVLPDPFTATLLYRIAQEAVHNGVKHSAPSHLQVDVAHLDDHAELRVHHDGFPGGELDADRGLGLRIMRHRADLLGAELHFHPTREGLTVRCVAPLRAPDHAGPEAPA